MTALVYNIIINGQDIKKQYVYGVCKRITKRSKEKLVEYAKELAVKGDKDIYADPINFIKVNIRAKLMTLKLIELIDVKWYIPDKDSGYLIFNVYLETTD